MHSSQLRSVSRTGTIPALALALLSAACGLQSAGSSHGGSSSSSGGSASSSGSTSSSGGGSSGSSGSSSGAACAGTSSKAEKQPLDIFIMLDRSLSMDDSVGGSTTKWSAVSSALSSFVGQPMDGTSIGLAYFPIESWSAPQGNSCTAADYARAVVEIGPLSQTASRIRDSMSDQTLQSGTPTSAALQGAIGHGHTWAGGSGSGHAVVVVLATDGDPTTCDTELSRVDAIAASGVSGSPSIRTFVIGVGNLKANLDGIARAGGTTAAFIVDTSGNVDSQFLQALNDIRGKAVDCSYVIPPPPSGQKLDYGKVNVEYQPGSVGSTISLGKVADAAGCGTSTHAWYYDDASAPTSIVLCPRTCSTIAADAAASVSIVLGCATNGEW